MASNVDGVTPKIVCDCEAGTVVGLFAAGDTADTVPLDQVNDDISLPNVTVPAETKGPGLVGSR